MKNRTFFVASPAEAAEDEYGISTTQFKSVLSECCAQSTSTNATSGVLHSRRRAFLFHRSDLAQSMGILGGATHPDVLATIDRAIEQIVGAGRTAGALVDDGNVEGYMEKGVRFMMTGWPSWVTSGAQAFKAKLAK